MNGSIHFLFLLFPAYIYCIQKIYENRSKVKYWYWDEYKQSKLESENEEEISIYDEKFKSSRNYESEAAYIAGSISLKPEHTVLEVGAGAAELSIRLARLCKKVIAADISVSLLSYAAKKAVVYNAENIEFLHSGVLDIPLMDGILDAVVSQTALHDMPELWKSAAIQNIWRLLKPGGKFFLTEKVVSFNSENNNSKFRMNELRRTAGENFANEFMENIKDEFPVNSRVIEQMLIKAGFTIDRIDRHNELVSSFICTKL